MLNDADFCDDAITDDNDLNDLCTDNNDGYEISGTKIC